MQQSPVTLTSIGSSAFEGCGSLKSISLPLSLKSIGSSAFDKCNSLIDVYAPAATPVKISGNSFSKVTMKEGILHVKNGMTDNYYLDKQWKKFINIVKMD